MSNLFGVFGIRVDHTVSISSGNGFFFCNRAVKWGQVQLSMYVLVWLAELEGWLILQYNLMCAQWQALVIPLTLTSFMYTGSFVLKLLSMIKDLDEHSSDGRTLPVLVSCFQNIVDWAITSASSVSAWRNYVVVRVPVYTFRNNTSTMQPKLYGWWSLLH